MDLKRTLKGPEIDLKIDRELTQTASGVISGFLGKFDQCAPLQVHCPDPYIIGGIPSGSFH